ncbi:MAG: undecaprenyl-diphosphate phosphatase [candidate division WOR-3 bacterium]|nr:MAG: undecaprenyl-diphosphate phosphatase [candidate division WOR-3 bacterium]
MIEAITLGLVQGLTEFLPISSSGHLAIVENLLGITEPVTLAVFLHFGTFVSIVVFFFRPIMDLVRGSIKGERESLAYLGKIGVATVPVAVGGALLRPWVARAFGNIFLVAVLLGVTGAVVLLTGVVRKRQGRIGFWSSVLIGIGQMVSILPGVSRSGMTISTGVYSGIRPERAFRFSFLLSLPAILGANLFELRNLTRLTDIPALIAGAACSFASGLVALAVLRRLVAQRFHYFGVYCIIISITLLLVL